MSKMPSIRETRRNMLRLWSYVAGHHRRGQEAGRATNQQSIHHVRWSLPGLTVIVSHVAVLQGGTYRNQAHRLQATVSWCRSLGPRAGLAMEGRLLCYGSATQRSTRRASQGHRWSATALESKGFRPVPLTPALQPLSPTTCAGSLLLRAHRQRSLALQGCPDNVMSRQSSCFGIAHANTDLAHLHRLVKVPSKNCKIVNASSTRPCPLTRCTRSLSWPTHADGGFNNFWEGQPRHRPWDPTSTVLELGESLWEIGIPNKTCRLGSSTVLPLESWKRSGVFPPSDEQPRHPASLVKASVFCNVSARSRHFVNVDVIFLPSVCDSFCVSTLSLRSFCHELYEQSTVMFCWSGRDACFTIVCILCADHVYWYPWFICREFNSFVLPLVCMQT